MTEATPPRSRRLTVAEFFALYGDQPVEVINGEVVYLSPNPREIMEAAGLIFASLHRYAADYHLGSVWIETASVLDADPGSDWANNVRQPDVSFVAQNRIAPHDAEFGRGGPWRLAPDLAVEVVSPIDGFADVMGKVLDYLKYGVHLVWVIDTSGRSVMVHQPGTNVGRLTAADTLTAEPVIPGWSMPLAELFGPTP